MHEIGHVTGLLDALNAKSDKTHKHALNDLSDVDAPDPANYHVMVRIGDKWVSAALLLGHISGWEDTVDAKIDGKIAALAGGAPATLDTFAEIAAALGEDLNFATTISTALGNRLRFDDVQTRTAAERTQAQTNLGGTEVGRAVFGSADKAAARNAIGAVPASHPHPISEVTGLQGALDGKSNNGHGHVIGEISGLQAALNGKLSTAGFDWISTVGIASDNPNAPYVRRTSTGELVMLQTNLGYTPVTTYGANRAYFGWNGAKVVAQIDSTYMGAIAFEDWVNANFATLTNVNNGWVSQQTADAVGSYRYSTTAGPSITFGGGIAGSSLNGAPPGTWRCMSHPSANGSTAGIFVRVA
ncbi:Uncharacterised protein [Starkeya nomas]|uniref:Phage tail collar domain-containing protein n=1 Tax=Starkeya nomas TaxID=2666134 RepID=A0A5S9R467_9HYPH|nr:Uncharacterised protein [Starkeya nomas]